MKRGAKYGGRSSPAEASVSVGADLLTASHPGERPARPRMLIIGTTRGKGEGTPSVSEELAARFERAGYPIFRTPAARGRLGRFLVKIWAAIRFGSRTDVALVDLYSGAAFRWAQASCAILSLQRTPFMITLHGGGLPTMASRHPMRVRRLLARAALVTAPSGYLVERMRAYRTDIRLIPNPIDLRRYPVRDEAPYPDRRLGPGAQPPLRLLWLRAYQSAYNPLLAVKVLHILRVRGVACLLTMFGRDLGDGTFRRCREAARDLAVERFVSFGAEVLKEEVPGVLARHDIYLNTTNVDNTPVTVIEALAASLPVVSTNVGGLPFLLVDGIDALLVRPDDPGAMATAVQRILNEPGLAARLQSQGRIKAESFDWSVVLPRWENAVTEATRTKY